MMTLTGNQHPDEHLGQAASNSSKKLCVSMLLGLYDSHMRREYTYCILWHQ